MKRLAFLVILVTVTASMTGCRRGLLSCGSRGNQNGSAPMPTCTPQPCTLPPCPCPAGTVPASTMSMPTMSAPSMMAPMMMAPSACDCGANAAPVVGGASYSMGNQFGSSVIDGTPSNMIGSLPAGGLPMDSRGSIYGSQIPMQGLGANIVSDRALNPGEVIGPNSTIQVGQK